MPKKSSSDQAKVNAKLLDAILTELSVSNNELAKLSARQQKAGKELHKLKKKLAKIKSCNCCKGKKKKSRKKKKSNDVSAAVNGHEAFALQNVLDVPTNGQADDLKWIAGVGPKLEETLNDLGVYHFEQIAAWEQAEIDWVDDYLKFSGRIERDNWIEQAKALAKGGWDEYVKVFGKEPR